MELRLHRTEQLTILLLVGMVSLAISATDWLQRGMVISANLFAAALAAVVLLYWLPMITAYVTIVRLKLRLWLLQLLTFYIAMVIGCWCWGQLRSHLLGTEELGLFAALGIALPWSSGIYLIVTFYLSQQSLKQEKQQRQLAEIKLLHSQLNPHFMFNSLNTIAAFADTSPSTTQKLVHNLAAVLRYSMQYSTTAAKAQTQVTLADELVALNQWCEIEQCRFGKDLVVTFDIDERLLNLMLPPMMLQPIVENAIKHAKHKPLHVTVSVQQQKQHAQFTVMDNGIGFSDKALAEVGRSGYGLSITRSRLQLEAAANLAIGNRPDGEMSPHITSVTAVRIS